MALDDKVVSLADLKESHDYLKNSVDDINADLEKVALVDGSYSSMTVGNAEQLVATVGEEDNAPYNFRTSGGTIDIGDRETDMVVGGTVCWNQLVKNGNFVDNSGWGVFISCANNIATFTGGQQGAYNTTIARTSNNLVPNHKLLIIADVRCSSSTRCRTRYPFVGSTGTSLSADTWVQHHDIGTSLANMNQIGIQFDGITDATYNVKNFVCFDLTQMFGSTIADYIYSLEQANEGAGVAWFKKLFPKDYYEYNTGELMNVKTSAHKMVGFNAWDEEWEVGDISAETGENVGGNATIRSKNYIPILPSTNYYFCVAGVTSATTVRTRFYDADKNYIGANQKNGASIMYSSVFTTPDNAYYMRFTPQASYGTTYKNDICINLSWDGERDGEYEEYVEHVYPLDSSLELRGIPKLDSANNLYYDGDTYESDGTVTRRFGVVTFDGSEDEGWTVYGGARFFCANVTNFVSPAVTELSNILNDGGFSVIPKTGMPTTNTGVKYISAGDPGTKYFIANFALDTLTEVKAYLVSNPLTVIYELSEPTTEEAEPYQNPQIVDDFGTEEYVDERAVPIPVGHQTKYLANLRAKLEMAPDNPSADGEYIVKQTNGQNEYIALGSSTTMQSILDKLPSAPSEDGTYTLTVTVANGTATYSWGANS